MLLVRTFDPQANEDRRAIAHAFSDIALAHVEHFVLCNVQIFCDLLVSQEAEPGKWGAAQNMSDLANWLTFDIVGELAFGNSSFKTLTEPDNRIVIDLIANNAYRCHMVCSYLYRYLHSNLIL